MESAHSAQCSSCGAELAGGFRFCGHCGQPVVAAAPAPSTDTIVSAPGDTVGESSTPAQAFRITAVRPDGRPTPPHALGSAGATCGREAGEIRMADDPFLSPRHARFTVRDGRAWIEDLGSANGTFLRLREPLRLLSGDEIRIGRQLLRLEPQPRGVAEPEVNRAWGSPDPGNALRLVQLLDGGGEGEVFPLRPGANHLGREAGDITFPADRYVSGRHARIDVSGAEAKLTDVGSSNGTYVRIREVVEIATGDQVLVGMQLLRVDG
jgi:pSer/pThr/pTyr-binding forkhead associated (FHA) protein